MKKSPNADVFTKMNPTCGVYIRSGGLCNHPVIRFNKGCEYYTVEQARECPIHVPIKVCEICWNVMPESKLKCCFCGTITERGNVKLYYDQCEKCGCYKNGKCSHPEGICPSEVEAQYEIDEQNS